MTVTCPDVSEFQTPLTDDYGRRLLIMRVTFGAHYLDRHFLANAKAAKRLHDRGEIDGVILYVVYLASATPAQQFAAAKKAVGLKPPAWLAGFMIDVETWRGQSYAIRGDHSKPINQLGGLLAGYMRTFNAVLIYGNRGDLAEVCPKRDRRFRVIVASYGSQLVYKQVKGAIGQQYTNGQSKWAAPKIGGKPLPRSSAPFGACDHNVFPGFKTERALVASMRPTAAKPPAAKSPVKKPPVAVRPPVKKPPAAKPRPLPYPAAAAPTARLLVADDRRSVLYLTNSGRLEVRRDSKHVRYL
jgi:hypothetical protein